MTKKRVTIIVGLILSVVLLWWALRDVSLAEVIGQLRAANLWLLAAAALAMTVTFGIRAIRWRILLLPALAESSFRSRFSAVCIGFMANNLLPARLGEFARVFAFARTEPISMSATFASLVLERLFDALILVIFLLPAIYLPGIPGGASPVVRHAFAIAGVLVVGGLLVLGLLVRLPDRALRVAERLSHRVLPRKAADRITGMLASFIAGLGALRHASVLLRVIGWTFVVWLWNGASFWLGLLAFDIRGPGFPGALLLQSIIGFAVSIPSSPGFFGPFEAASRVGLSIYGVDPTKIVSFAVGIHVFSFIPVTLLGLWYAHRLGISLSDVEHSEEYVEAAVERGDDGDGGP